MITDDLPKFCSFASRTWRSDLSSLQAGRHRGACHARNAFAKHVSGMERLKAAWATGKEWAGIARSNPARTMKLLSAVSGALLIIGGISGVVNIFNPLGIVISIYNM